MQHSQRRRAYEVALVMGLIAVQILLVGWYLYRSGQILQFQTGVTVISLTQGEKRAELSPYGPGFERELMQQFARFRDVRLKWREADSWEEARNLLFSGRADILLAPGTPPRSWDMQELVAGPAYSHAPSVLVHHRQRFGLRSIYDLCRIPVHIPNLPAVETIFTDSDFDVPCRPDIVKRQGLGLQGLLQFMQTEQARFAVVDKQRFQAWAPFYPQVRQTYAFPKTAEIAFRWYWHREAAATGEALARFWNRSEQKRQLRRLQELYTGFFPAQPDYYELAHLSKAVQEKLQRYLPTIRRAAEENGLDPLWLVAMIYQESHFEARAESYTGVRGLMQLTQPTARELGIKNRRDPEQSILGGARYVKYLWQRLEGHGLSPWDRWFLALAAYNQGFSHAENAIRLTEELGKDPQFWGDIKSVFPLLSYSRYYTQFEDGGARGFEAVDYVQSIRWYYYVLHGFVALSRPEAEYLAPLLGLVPQGWPG
ncbi:MAG: transglycosylase SLT domain-containing protein [Desulfohalobium sp.]